MRRICRNLLPAGLHRPAATVRPPNSGHVKLVTRKHGRGRQANVRTLSFELSELPAEPGKEAADASAKPKIHVRWEKDNSILEDLHYLRGGRRQVVVNLNLGSPQRKVPVASKRFSQHNANLPSSPFPKLWLWVDS